jgi:hypothetical protein
LAKFTSPSREGAPERGAIFCSFSLKNVLQTNSAIPASRDAEVRLYRREFQRLAFTSLLLSYLTKLFRSGMIREAAEEMHWNAVMCAENAMDLAVMDKARPLPLYPSLGAASCSTRRL